jgi:dihydroflavonol-4-reductase
VASITNQAAVGRRLLLTSPESYTLVELGQLVKSYANGPDKPFERYALPTKASKPVLHRPRFNAQAAIQMLGLTPKAVTETVVACATGLFNTDLVSQHTAEDNAAALAGELAAASAAAVASATLGEQLDTLVDEMIKYKLVDAGAAASIRQNVASKRFTASYYVSLWEPKVAPLRAAAAEEAVAGPRRANTVCVTGATGYLGAVLTSRLLERGYQVRGTVRGLEGAPARQLREKVGTFPNGTSNSHLTLHHADLMTHGAFAEAFAGCATVMHTAAPYFPTVPGRDDPQRLLADPHVQGTLNVLKEARQAGHVARVIMTSSTAAVTPYRVSSAPDFKTRVYTEDDWNADATYAQGSTATAATAAERAAWEFLAAEQGFPGADKFSFAVINSGFIVGPPLLARGDGASVGFFKAALEGAYSSGPPTPTLLSDLAGEINAQGVKTPTGCVDVRDVADAHIAAMVVPDAGGQRFLVTVRARPGRLSALSVP